MLGALCGALLHGLRLPLGRELLEMPAVPAGDAYLVRGIALAAVALVLLFARRTLDGRPNGALLAGAFLGFAAEGLAGDLRTEAASATFPLVPVALALVLLREQRRPAPAPAGERASVAALAACGAGMAIGLEGLARHLRLLGGGLAEDDAVFGAVLLLAMAFGGAAFGAPLVAGRARGAAVTVSLALGGATLFLALVAVRGVATPRGLRAFLGRFGLDASLYGQLPTDALLAAVVFVLPAFALGTAIVCARHRSELAALLLGGAAGLQAVPRLLDPGDAALDALPYNAQLVRVGAFVVGAGALLAAWTPTRRRLRPLPLALGLALLTAAAALRVQHVKVLQAWTRFPVPHREVFDVPEGQILVQPSAPGVERVTLDHRPLTPGRERARADAELVRVSLELLSDAARARGPRVLFVGQLTPGRSLVLREEGVALVDRTAAWWRVMGRLERRLFAGREDALPEGRVRSLADARADLERGAYDLVLVPPVPGRAPLVPRAAPPLPAGTAAVAWLDAGSSVARRAIDRPLLLTAGGLAHPSVGVVWGVEPPVRPTPGRSAAVAAGAPAARPRILEWLRTRHDARAAESRADLFARIAEANAGGEWRFLTRALALHYAAQERSSPWETAEQQVEIDARALAELTDAASLGPPARTTRELWDEVARVLVGKRDVEAIHDWIAPVAGTWAPWSELELALAHADLESLDAEAAVGRLAPLFAQRPDDLELGALLAHAQSRGGDAEAAAETWRELSRRNPGDRGAARGLVQALVSAGAQEEARPLLEELLREDPEDRELWGLLAPRPPGGEGR